MYITVLHYEAIKLKYQNAFVRFVADMPTHTQYLHVWQTLKCARMDGFRSHVE